MTTLSTSIITDAANRLTAATAGIDEVPVDGTFASILRLSEIVDAALDVSAALSDVDDTASDDAVVAAFAADLRLCELLEG